MIGFHTPSYLVFGALALGAAVAASFLARRKGTPSFFTLSPLRFLAIGIILGALSSPYWQESQTKNVVPLFLDISESMDPVVAQELLSKAEKLGRDAKLDIEITPFSKTSAPYSTTAQGGQFHGLRRSWEKLDLGGSNLERALQDLADHAGGDEVRALLISDGFETEGDAASILPSLSAKGVKLFPLTPKDPRGLQARFKISNLYAPLLAPAQKSVEIRTTIQNTTNELQSGVLHLTHDSKTIFKEDVRVEPGAEVVVTAPSDPSQEGIKEITATLTPSSKEQGASTESIFISGEQRERVLLINGSSEDARFLPEVLKEQAYQLSNQTLSGSQAELSNLKEFSAVILNNVALTQLPSGGASRIEEYVRGGGGFIMTGGNKSFGLGGYLGSPVADILPVELVPPQTVQKRLNVALELVLDKSGSMGQGGKLDFAKEAAREVIRNLKDEDYIGVIGFDSAPWVVVKLAPLSEVREVAIERVGRLFPAQKTNLFPAIDEARRSLLRVNAGRKHMIILTDGKVPDSGPYYVELTKQMRLLGITVSTVMLGGEADVEMLKDMANAGGGAFYQTLDAANLPKIFLSDVKTASGEKTLREQSEYGVRAGPAGILSTTIRNFPPLRGYVQTKPREEASLELVVTGGDKAEPLLASWKVGSGHSVAFTSDTNGRWSSQWISWEKFSRFFTELVDSIRPESKDKGEKVRFDLRHFVERGVLTLDLAIYSEDASGSVQGTLILPNGEERIVSFANLARGRFKAEVSPIMAGKYELRATAAGRKLTPVAFVLSGELFGEKKGEGFNIPVLSRLATGSGGELNPTEVQLKGGGLVTKSESDISPWFLLLAGILLFLEILYREVWSKRRDFFRSLFTFTWLLPLIKRVGKRSTI